MTEEVKTLILQRAEWYKNKDKRVWQPDELAYTYQIYNMHFGENRMDTGCGSCRRSIINHIRGLYSKIVQEKQI